MQQALLCREVIGDLVGDVTPGKGGAVGRPVEEFLDGPVGCGVVPAGLHKDVPGIESVGIVHLAQQHRARGVERRADLEVAVDARNDNRIGKVLSHLEVGRILRNAQFAQGILVDVPDIRGPEVSQYDTPVGIGHVVVAQPFETQNPEIGRVADEDLKRDHPVGPILEGIVVAAVVGRSASESDGFDLGQRTQLVAEVAHHTPVGEDTGFDIEDVARLVSHRGVHQMADLESDGDRGGEQGYCNDILQSDEHPSVNRLGVTAEGAAYDVDRLVARHEQCRHQPRDHAQHDNGQQAPARNRP